MRHDKRRTAASSKERVTEDKFFEALENCLNRSDIATEYSLEFNSDGLRSGMFETIQLGDK